MTSRLSEPCLRKRSWLNAAGMDWFGSSLIRNAELCRATISLTSLQPLVGAGRELGEEIVLVKREVLDEGHGHDLLLGINLAIGRGGAVPAELSDRRRNRELPEVRRYLHTETEPLLARCRLIVWQRDHVIRRHQLNRFAAESSVAFQRAAVEQHLREPRVVARRRKQPAAAAFNTAT